MISDLRLPAFSPLPLTQLGNVGRINVVCGRNNSGKTTVLDAIANRSSVGIPLTGEILNDLVRLAMQSLPRGLDMIASDLFRLMSRFASQSPILFGGDVKDLIRPLWEYTQRSSILRDYTVDLAGVESDLNSRLAKPKSIMVPAERSVLPTDNPNPQVEVQPNGAGLLPYLHWASNQYEGTEARKQFAELSDAFGRISSGYRLWVRQERTGRLYLEFSYRNGDWIAAEKSGLGLRDLLLILHCITDRENTIICIEEPETHIHPFIQKKLLAYMSHQSDQQFFLSTHSNVFLNNAHVNRVFFITFTGSIQVLDETKLASMLDDLGYSVADNLVSDVVVLVEGPTDTPIVEEFLKTLGILDRFDIKFWPLGGDNMEYVDLSVFAQESAVLAIVDNDPGSKRQRETFVAKCEEAGVPVTRLERYSIENYFPLRVLKEYFGNNISDTITGITPKTPLHKQIGIDVKPHNRALAQRLIRSEIEAMGDLYDFLMKVEERCRLVKEEKPDYR